MKTHRLVLLIVFTLATSYALAQTPPRPPAPPKAPAPPAAAPDAPPPPPPAPPAPPAPRGGQAVNIRVDTTITETGGNGPAVKKSVTAVAGDGFDASVREVASGQNVGPTSLNVDASPTILTNGKIRVRVTLQYSAGQAQASEQRIRTDLRQTLVLILENGKPQVISEASDPLSDRRVTVEVTATILK